MEMKKNTLYYGDCLEVMGEWADKSVDLIYLDPPFNSKADYNIIFGTHRNGGDNEDLAQLTAFTDTWEWDEKAEKRVALIKSAIAHPARRAILAFSEIYPDGSGMLSYLSYMAERIAEMHRLLKDTGSLYLHCDSTASHYLKLILDEVFGKDNFKNEIIWHYQTGGASKRHYSKKHDTILFYSKTRFCNFYPQAIMMERTEKSLRRAKNPKGARITTDDTTKLPMDVWVNIQALNPMAKERLKYPTQKPVALLKRIVMASSKEGDLVLDPFCGCGTTIAAAHSLKRNWIGIDISAYAIEVVRRERMKDMRINLAGMPKDLKGATHFAHEKPFDFEQWAVTRIPGFAPNKVQRGDGGIDGRALIYGAKKPDNLCIAQVKGGKPNIDSLRAFSGVIASGKAAIGIFITLKKWDTPAVRKCVTQAGTFKRGETEFNRLVMYALDDHFRGIDDPKLPPLAHPHTGEAFQEEMMPASLLDEETISPEQNHA